MTHVLLVTYGSHGDINPFMGLGLELQARGHRATLVANRHFEEIATRAGLGFAPMGTEEQYDATIRDADFWNPSRAPGALVRHAFAVIPEGIASIGKSARDNDTVILGSRYAFAALLARDLFGLRAATVLLNLTSLRSAYAPPKLFGSHFADSIETAAYGVAFRAIGKKIRETVGASLDSLRVRIGLGAVDDFESWWNSSEFLFAAWPEWLYPRQPDWPQNVRHIGFVEHDGGAVDFDLSKILPEEFIGQRPVVFTSGTAVREAGDFFQRAMEVCVLLQLHAIFLSGYPEPIPQALPPAIRYISYAPLQQVLHHASAIVHHGGIGTCARGLRAGIPQVIRPLAHDQFENAERLRKLGVANIVDTAGFSTDVLALNLSLALSSRGMLERCQQLSQEPFGDALPPAVMDFITRS